MKTWKANIHKDDKMNLIELSGTTTIFLISNNYILLLRYQETIKLGIATNINFSLQCWPTWPVL